MVGMRAPLARDTILCCWMKKNGSARTMSASKSARWISEKARSRSVSVDANAWNSARCKFFAAPSRPSSWPAVASLFGFASTPMRRARGTACRTNSRRFAVISRVRLVRPVALPPGLARLATSPFLRTSEASTNTIGVRLSARFSAIAAGALYTTRMCGRVFTSSATTVGNCSMRGKHQRSITRFPPMAYPASSRPRRRNISTGRSDSEHPGGPGRSCPNRVTLPVCCASLRRGVMRRDPARVSK